MKKIVLVMALLAGVALGIPLGTLYTQSQLDAVSNAQIRDNTLVSFDSLLITSTDVMFFFDIDYLAKQVTNRGATGDYEYVRESFRVVFDKQKIKNCIAENSKQECLDEHLMPKLIRSIDNKRFGSIEDTVSWKTDSRTEFTEQELNNILGGMELNPNDRR